MPSKFLNLSTDDTLGGNSPSNDVAVSQKSIKKYIDDHSGGGGSVSVDGISINRNASNELQTIGVINQNDTTTAIKTWTGTKAQYDAIVSKDPNTLYEVEGYGVFLGTTQIAAGSAELNNPFTLFEYQFSDHILNNASWLRADTFSWQSGSVYVSAYEHLVDDIDGITAETETIGSNTITFYRATDGHKICLADQENIVTAIYADTGVAWYYILDTANTRFKLPRTKFGVTGLRGAVGDYVAAGLPNITGTFTGGRANVSPTGAFSTPSAVSTVASGSSNCRVYSLDASNSSSIYGNSTTVQPRATEMYLYFYVGETIQDATLIDVGEITDTLNGKADVDLTNVIPSSSFKQASVTWGMPDYSARIDYDRTSTTVKTAPSKGYILLNYFLSASGNAPFNINGSEVVKTYRASGNGYVSNACYMFPVEAGDTFQITQAIGTSYGTYSFLPMKGV